MSKIILPIIVLSVIIYATIKKSNVYDSFVEGAREGFIIVKDMFPSLLSMIFAVNIFTSSEITTFALSFLKPLLNIINIPFEIIPVAILRPLSGSFGIGLLNNIYNIYGVDSFTSILSSVIQGSSDTTIYIITLYFGSLGVKKIKYALWIGLLADFIMVILSIILVPILT